MQSIASVGLTTVDRLLKYAQNPKQWTIKRQDECRKLFQNDPTLLEARSYSTQTAGIPPGHALIHICAIHHHLAMAEILLATRAGEQLEWRTPEGQTALHLASAAGQADMIRLLLAHGADPTAEDLEAHSTLVVGLLSPVAAHQAGVTSMLKQELFSPGDVSIVGNREHLADRSATAEHVQAAVGWAEMGGLRILTEDVVLVDQGPNYLLVGVFDGHGDGGKCAAFVAGQVKQKVRSDFMAKGTVVQDWPMAWKTAFLEIDAQLLEQKIPGGTTATVALILKDEIITAHVGDCRCVLVQQEDLAAQLGKLSLQDKDSEQLDKDANVQVTALTTDHSAAIDEEGTRIQRAGADILKVEKSSGVLTHKVMVTRDGETAPDLLDMSRSFGDKEFKANAELGPDEQAVIAAPQVTIHSRVDADAFLIVACDGIWDVRGNDQVASLVLQRTQEGLASEELYLLPRIGDHLMDVAFDHGSEDNMSVAVVALGRMASQLPSHVVRQLDSDF